VTETFNILWRDIGCPMEPGTYTYAGKPIRVGRRHIDAAQGNPDAVFCVLDISAGGEPRYVLSMTHQSEDKDA
jgi:hypothetical protein